MTNVWAYQQLKPCIAPGLHDFKYDPSAGAVCSRCGMTRAEAQR